MAIEYEKRDGVAYITINNIDKANILDKATSDDISAAWVDLWEDRDIRCGIVTGAGDRHFCGGHNLAPRPDLTDDDREYLRTNRIYWPLAGHGARTANRCRWPDGRSLSTGMEADHRGGERLGGGGGPLSAACVDRHPDRQRRTRAVQIRLVDPGLAWPRTRARAC